ncbi:hypothetical protein NMG60_11028578 [Bertholletia excelsa]
MSSVPPVAEDCTPEQNNALMAARQEIGGSAYIPDWKSPVICPKPRRVWLLTDNPRKLLTGLKSHKLEIIDPKHGGELGDVILNKENFGAEQFATLLSSSPPFFSGSPPSRTTNPLIQDVRFGEAKHCSVSTLAIASPSSLSSSSSSASAHKGGCTWMKFGHKPAAVRVEGFDCLGRNHRHSSITVMA